MKYIGALMIIISSYCIGKLLAEQLNQHIKVLKSFKQLFQQFRINIEYRLPALYEMFSDSTDMVIMDFTQMIADMISKGYSPELCIKETIENADCVKVLSMDEKRFVISILSEKYKGIGVDSEAFDCMCVLSFLRTARASIKNRFIFHENSIIFACLGRLFLK